MPETLQEFLEMVLNGNGSPPRGESLFTRIDRMITRNVKMSRQDDYQGIMVSPDDHVYLAHAHLVNAYLDTDDCARLMRDHEIREHEADERMAKVDRTIQYGILHALLALIPVPEDANPIDRKDRLQADNTNEEEKNTDAPVDPQ